MSHPDAARPEPTALRRALYYAICVVAGTCLPLLAAEAVLRIVGWPQGTPVGWRWRGGDPAEANEFGCRGHRASGPVSDAVVLLGDSQVERGPFDEMPEIVFAQALKERTGRDARVVSLAASGWGQDQQLLALRRFLPQIKPRLVALWFTASNDVWNNTFPTHYTRRGRPKPTFWLEGEELLGPHAPWLARQSRYPLYLLRILYRARRIPDYVTDDEWERRLPPPYRPVPIATDSEESVPKLRDFIAAQRGVAPEEVLYFDEEDFASEKTNFDTALCPRSARLLYSAKLTRALLREMQTLCEAHGAQFVVFWHEEGTPDIPDAPTRFAVHGHIVTLSRDAAKDFVRGVLTVGPTLAIPRLPRGSTVSRSDRHLNTVGNRYVLSALSQWLVDQQLGGFLADK